MNEVWADLHRHSRHRRRGEPNRGKPARADADVTVGLGNGFRDRSLRELADMICGNFDSAKSFFRYRSSSYLTEFFQDCDTDYLHDGTTRWYWVSERLREILAGPHPQLHALPITFSRVIRTLMDPNDATNEGPDR
ncbi:MAG: hypothetical protein WA709_07790, partial [Stellaceae bacterium]